MPYHRTGVLTAVSAILQRIKHAFHCLMFVIQLPQVTTEQKERWYPATSIEEYAETIWRVALTNNPFADPDRLQLLGVEQQQFHDTYVTTAVESITQEDRHDAASKRVLSPYTVLHVLATVE